jgi:hypothetical protein
MAGRVHMVQWVGQGEGQWVGQQEGQQKGQRTTGRMVESVGVSLAWWRYLPARRTNYSLFCASFLTPLVNFWALHISLFLVLALFRSLRVQKKRTK